jgi:hypothetical protein
MPRARLGGSPPVVVSGPATVPAEQVDAVILLIGCPPDLLLAHDEHLSDLTRDLSLYAASHDDRSAAGSAGQVLEVVRLSARTWDRARLVATHAVREHRSTVDIALGVVDPADVPRKVEVLRSATRAADEMAREGRLTTMPAPLAVQRWRDRVAIEMVEQSTTGRDPVTFPQLLGSDAG